MASRWSCAHAHTWSAKGTRCVSGPVRQGWIYIAYSQPKPRRRTSGSAPHLRINCMVSRVSAVARGWLLAVGRRSTISGASPPGGQLQRRCKPGRARADDQDRDSFFCVVVHRILPYYVMKVS